MDLENRDTLYTHLSHAHKLTKIWVQIVSLARKIAF